MDSKMVNISSPPVSPAVVVSFLISQMAPLIVADKDDQLYFAGIIPVVFGCIHYTLSYVDLGLSLPHFKLFEYFPRFTCCDNIRIYIETAVVVVISYVSLLVVNWSYIWLAVFPVIAIGFIVALCSELNHQSGLLQQHNDGEACVSRSGDQEGRKLMKKAGEGLEAVALVPYWVLCMMGQFHADKFSVSQFLLFFSFMLGALTLMMERLALTGVAPGVAPASVLLRRASLVVLLLAVHAVAAELLGEEVVLFCLPEFAPVLLWFSIHLDRCGNSVVTADEIKLHRNGLTVLGAVAAAVMALLAAVMDESVLFSWCSKTLVAFGVSGFLIYYVVFMLCQWPGQDSRATPYLQEAVKLLKFWANVLLIGAAMLMVFTFLAAVRLGLHEPMVTATVEFVNEYVSRFSSS